MRCHQVAAWILPVLALGACSNSKDETQLVVTVWSDFAVPTEMDAIRLRVAGRERTIDHPFQLTSSSEPGKYSVPIQLGLVPGGAKDGAIAISAIGSRRGTDMVWQQASLQFIPDQAHELVLYLAKACENVQCGEDSGLTCEKGACTRPIAMKTQDLPAYSAGQAPTLPSPTVTDDKRDAAAPVQDAARTIDATAKLDSPVKADVMVNVPDAVVAGKVNLTVSVPSVDLGVVDVGLASTPVTVEVTNTGTASSGQLTVSVSGSGLTATGCNGAVLAPKAACTISITARPATAGPISGTVQVGDSQTTHKVINISGVAAVPGQFTLTPNVLDLGKVVTGKSATGTVVLTNSGSAALTGIIINVGGTGFASDRSGTCTEALGVGQTCNLVVTFTAGTTSGQAKGTLTVNQGGVTKTVSLSATVSSAAKLVMSPVITSLQTVVGTPSSPVTFYVTNSGDMTSTIPVISLTGTNKEDFTQTNDCVTALPGGATSSCKIVVVFNPKVAKTGNATATLTVAESGAGGSSVNAALTGTAIQPSSLVITGTPVDFGAVVVGGTSVQSNFTVTNAGGTSSGSLQITTTPSQFSIVSDGCSDKNLATKTTCVFGVQFRPAAGDVGVMQGQLKATGANTENPAFLSVTGTAVPAAKLAITPLSQDFGSIPALQESPPVTLTVSNDGGAPTGALKVENTGAQFTVKGDTCTGAILTASGTSKSCTITATFTPTGSKTEATGSIVVTDTTGAAGQATATMRGAGVAPASMSISPSKACPQYLDDDDSCVPSLETSRFTDMPIGQTSPEMAFTIFNNSSPSDAPDSGSLSLQITGANAADFKIVTNNCTVPLISTGTTPTSCVVTLAFTPSAAGLRYATLQLSTSRGGVAKATLEGKGQ